MNIFFIANLYVYANAAELKTPLSGILGGDIDGVAVYDYFGSAIATSSDGSRVVVGARDHDSTEEVTDSNATLISKTMPAAFACSNMAQPRTPPAGHSWAGT